ncbi:MAG: gamma-glutamylcyclotransferase [Candidatus Poseidoniaceae archaeon]
MNKMAEKIPTLYFGYGSNLDKEDWTKWCEERGKDSSGLKELGPAWLDEYQLVFDYYSSSRECGAANLVKVASGMAATPGALFEIDEYTLKLLDRKEGVKIQGCYQREIVTVFTADGQSHEAVTYIHISEDPIYHEPSEHYESLIRNGLARLNLPTTWLDFAIGKEIQPRFDLVFVYGTLMRGKSRHSEMNDGCEFVCDGTTQGYLYHVSDYPGLVAGEGFVSGELFKAVDMFEVIQRLDWVEGANGKNPLFNRVIRKITTEQGEFWAYSYNYNRGVEESQLIASGKWN